MVGINRKKSWVVACSIILIVVIITGGTYAYHRYSADEEANYGQIDNDTLALLAASQKPDVPVIQLDYTKTQIETAIADYRNTSLADLNSLSDLDKQINAKIDSLSKEKIQSQSDSLAVIIVDKDKNKVDQTVGTRSAGVSSEAVANIADNFDFAAEIPQTTKNILTDAYVKIQKIYGPRSNKNKIKVIAIGPEGCAYGRSCVGSNSIMLKPGDLTDIYVNTHELIHTFHGSYIMRPLWEEGMTESATEILLADKIESGEVGAAHAINAAMTNYEINNLPYYSFKNTLTAEGPDAYMWGAAAIYKIYLENHNFYKLFNAKLYRPIQSQTLFEGDPALIQLVSQIVPKVEGEKTTDWFSHQYAFITPGNDISKWADSSVANAYYNSIDKKIEFHYFGDSSKIKTLSLKAYYANGDLVGSCSGDTSDDQFIVQRAEIDIQMINSQKCQNIKYIPDYHGYIKNVITVNNDNSQQIISYDANTTNAGASYAVKGIVIGESTRAILTNLDTRKKINVSVTNGTFTTADSIASGAGRFKLDIYNKNKLVKSRYFNKDDTTTKNTCGYTVFVDALANGANAKFSKTSTGSPIKIGVKSFNRSIDLSVANDSYTGLVFRLNGVPVFRTWGKNYSYSFNNLNKNKSYEWSLAKSDNSGLGSISKGKKKTLSGADLAIVSVQSSGSPQQNNYSVKVTFSKKVNITSNQLKLYNELDLQEMTIKKLSDTAIQIIPKHTYNNSSYYIDGLNNITDALGNPIYNFDWNMACFQTDINPKGAAAPSYSLSSAGAGTDFAADLPPTTTISSDAQYLVLTPNYKSADLLNKLSEIKIQKNFKLAAECFESDDECGPLKITVTNRFGKIVIELHEKLEAGKDYFVSVPLVIDDNNNIVNNGIDIFNMAVTFHVE